MARNSVFLSAHDFKQMKSIAVEINLSDRCCIYLREILWNTLDEFPRFLLLNLR